MRLLRIGKNFINKRHIISVSLYDETLTQSSIVHIETTKTMLSYKFPTLKQGGAFIDNYFGKFMDKNNISSRVEKWTSEL